MSHFSAKEMLAKFTEFLKKQKLIGEDETHTDFLNKENSNELLQEKFKYHSLMKEKDIVNYILFIFIY